jgi:hypothetical protein
MKVKIKSDGTLLGTKIMDAETGKELSNVRAFTISADADTQEFRVFLELFNVELEVKADAETGE